MGFDVNRVVIIGRLTRDVELSYTSNQVAICKFSIANNARGEKEFVNFFDVVVWNKMAELCNQYIKKGSQVLLDGRLQQERFQDREGNNRSRVKIVADTVQFLSSTGNAVAGIPATPQQEPPPPQVRDRLDDLPSNIDPNDDIPF